jgi:16S rRNA (uracil1498-N3)-methyltransferase
VPLLTERGVAQPTTNAAGRLERVVIEAAKQCGRNRLMRIALPQVWSEWLQPTESQGAQWRLVAHPGGRRVSELALQQHSPTRISIGPEGGLTDSEIAEAEAAGWQQVSLGSRILRVETAAISLAAAVALR